MVNTHQKISGQTEQIAGSNEEMGQRLAEEHARVHNEVRLRSRLTARYSSHAIARTL